MRARGPGTMKGLGSEIQVGKAINFRFSSWCVFLVNGGKSVSGLFDKHKGIPKHFVYDLFPPTEPRYFDSSNGSFRSKETPDAAVVIPAAAGALAAAL